MDELFADDTFILLTKDKSLKDTTEEKISESGGAVARAITKRVTVVVVDSASDFADDIKKAESLKVPVVEFSFITSSIDNKKRESPDNHKPGQGPASKKQKVDDAGLEAGSEWMGVSIAGDQSAYPFVLEIKTVTGINFTAQIKWPTLGSGAITKVKGTINGEDVKFEEYEAVVGEDDVELPMYYTAKLTKDKLAGKLKDSSGEESSFNLAKIKKSGGGATNVTAPAAVKKDLSGYQGLPSLQAGTQLKGVLGQAYEFKVVLASLSAQGQATGTVAWPSVSALTAFDGEIKNDEFTFNETKILKGDGIEIPVKYSGKIDDTTKNVTGSYDAPSSKGLFTLTAASK